MNIHPSYYLDLLSAGRQIRQEWPVEFLALWAAIVLPWAVLVMNALLLIGRTILVANGAPSLEYIGWTVLLFVLPYGYVAFRLVLYRSRVMGFPAWQRFTGCL